MLAYLAANDHDKLGRIRRPEEFLVNESFSCSTEERQRIVTRSSADQGESNLNFSISVGQPGDFHPVEDGVLRVAAHRPAGYPRVPAEASTLAPRPARRNFTGFKDQLHSDLPFGADG